MLTCSYKKGMEGVTREVYLTLLHMPGKAHQTFVLSINENLGQQGKGENDILGKGEEHIEAQRDAQHSDTVWRIKSFLTEAHVVKWQE